MFSFNSGLYIEQLSVEPSTFKKILTSLSKLSISTPDLCSIMSNRLYNFQQLGVFSKGTILYVGSWLWAWFISGGFQTCIAERTKVSKGQNTNCVTLKANSLNKPMADPGFFFLRGLPGDSWALGVPRSSLAAVQPSAIFMANPIVQNLQVHT